MKKVVSLGLLTLITGVIYTGEASANCNDLNINISNLTQNACKLIKSEIKHGYFHFHTFPPPYIPANSANMQRVIVESSVYGADLTLTYECGEGRRVTFNSRQEYNLFQAGDISGQVIDAHNLNANYSITQGTCWGGQPGIINWMLED